MPLSISCAVPTPCTAKAAKAASAFEGSIIMHAYSFCTSCLLQMPKHQIAFGAGTYVTCTDAPQTHESAQQRLTECLNFSAKLQDLSTVFMWYMPFGQASRMYLHQRIEGFIDHRHQHSVHNEAWPVIGVAHCLAQVLCKAIGSLMDLFASTPAS